MTIMPQNIPSCVPTTRRVIFGNNESNIMMRHAHRNAHCARISRCQVGDTRDHKEHKGLRASNDSTGHIMSLDDINTSFWKKVSMLSVAAMLTVSVMWGGVGLRPAQAIEYVPPEQMTSLAKPVKKQEVNKGKVWLLFVLGASTLFGVTIVVENNSAWFPAISRANKAMASAQAALAKKEEQGVNKKQIVDKNEMMLEEREDDITSDEEEDRLQQAVLSGIAEARESLRKVQQETRVPQELSVEEEMKLEEDIGREEVEKELRKPIFEISGDEIQQTTDAKISSTQKALEDVSLEDLQKEIGKRKGSE